MPDIYNYLDYREYLRDCYQEKKQDNPGFSYQVLANLAGFKSKSFLPHVIEGTRNLSEASIPGIVQALKLSEREREYFELLVAYGQARSHAGKQRFFEALVEKGPRTKARLLLQNYHEFYSHWYHNSIRELVTIVDFGEDYARLARMLKPRISARQARRSVAMLVRLGLLRKEGNRYVQADRNLTTGFTVQSLSVENFHLQNLNLAGESIDTCPAQHRELGCMVAGLSQQGFETVKKEMREFRSKLVSIINRDEPAERVYHIAMQLFPTSELPHGGDDDDT